MDAGELMAPLRGGRMLRSALEGAHTAPAMTATLSPTAEPSAALPTLADLDAAARLVYEVMPPTPQYRWPLLEARCGGEVWVKHENHAGKCFRAVCESVPLGTV